MMHRLLLVAASKSAAPKIPIRHATTPSSSPPVALRFLAARHFSETPTTDAEADANEIKVGTVKLFKLSYGFIVPDDVDAKNHRDDELIFLHQNEIKRVENDSQEKFFPQARRGQRVQFKVVPPSEGKNMWRAREVTMEGGDLLPPFHEGYLEKLIKSKKAKFGEEVFDIFGTAKDQTELETRIVEAYDKAKNEIERQRGRVVRASELAGHKYKEVEEK